MISFKYGWIKAGEVIIESSKTRDVNGITLIGAIQRAIDLSESPIVEYLQCHGDPKYEEGMSDDEFVKLSGDPRDYGDST